MAGVCSKINNIREKILLNSKYQRIGHRKERKAMNDEYKKE
jgi:hypothetical protein